MEKKPKKDGRWKPVSKFVRGTDYDVGDLDEGEEYEFRVSAVNENGHSEPLETTKPIIAKHQFGECLERGFERLEIETLSETTY